MCFLLEIFRSLKMPKRCVFKCRKTPKSTRDSLCSIVSENDQYDKYFYTAPAPRVTIEHSSDTESSRRPSQASPSISTSSSYSNLNKFDFSPSPRRNARKPSSNAPCRLNLPLGRSPGAHLASSASADDLFRMRNIRQENN